MAWMKQILDLGPGIYERGLQATRDVLAELEARLATRDRTKVRQDLGILIKALEDNIRTSELDREQHAAVLQQSARPCFSACAV